MRERTYFFRLFGHSRLLGWAVGLFFLLSVGANLAGVETTPFFVWGMFSKPETPQPEQPVWQFWANGELLDHTSWRVALFQRYFMTNPLAHSQAMREHGGRDQLHRFLLEKMPGSYPELRPFLDKISNDGSEGPAFEAWLKRYAEGAYGREFGEFEVRLVRARFGADGRAVAVDTTVLFNK